MDLDKTKKEPGGIAGYMARKKIGDDRRQAEAKLPPAEICGYCGESRRAYRDVGGPDGVARICSGCEKRSFDKILGKPEFESKPTNPEEELPLEAEEEEEAGRVDTPMGEGQSDDPNAGDDDVGKKAAKKKGKGKRGRKTQKVK